jgi:regulatory protein
MGTGARRRRPPAEQRAARALVDDPEVVLGAALRFLEARSRSVAEVRRRLASAGYRGDLVDAAVDRLTELGVLDDATFARAWLESRDRARPRGELGLRRELALKGIDRGTIDEVLDDRRSRGDGADDAAAELLLERHRRRLERDADVTARRARAYALLARNGFDPDTAARAARVFAGGPDEAT